MEATQIPPAYVGNDTGRSDRAERLQKALRHRVARLVAVALVSTKGDASADTLVGIILDGLGIAPADRATDPLPHVDDVVDALDATAKAVGETVEQLGLIAGLFDFVLAERPRGFDDMQIQLFAAMAEYERASAAVGYVAQAWGDEALRGPAWKQECITALMERDKISSTKAEAQITAYPPYAEHKQRLDTLLRAKYDAETTRDVAHVRVRTLGDISKVMVAAAARQ